MWCHEGQLSRHPPLVVEGEDPGIILDVRHGRIEDVSSEPCRACRSLSKHLLTWRESSDRAQCIHLTWHEDCRLHKGLSAVVLLVLHVQLQGSSHNLMSSLHRSQVVVSLGWGNFQLNTMIRAAVTHHHRRPSLRFVDRNDPRSSKLLHPCSL